MVKVKNKIIRNMPHYTNKNFILFYIFSDESAYQEIN